MKRVIAAASADFCAQRKHRQVATAAPVANSSGSVVNQAVQIYHPGHLLILMGRGSSCQGATLNISPLCHNYKLGQSF